ncbi:hypothetical protein GCM10010994_58490 [Chelatococcus reniformis]|uniref:DUF218 domain-containing protein n=2 Tax=Chelatococcus reniformis TaxID=1494448 RepID=A0A916UXP9_9HYPH|nr:hypothetical protein GCM10010994_58490 [Chelatococcus reniformis]
MIRSTAPYARFARTPMTGMSEWSAAGARLLGQVVHILGRLAAVTSVVAVIVLGGGFFWFVNAIERKESLPTESADGIVVLTGGAQRIDDAVNLLLRGQAQRLLVSGVNEKTSRGQIARLNPEAQRLFSCCVDLDYRARNTIGNAIETRRWVREHGFRSLIVVTSNYHMPRALVELSSVVEGAQLRPHVVVTDQSNPDRWWYEPMTARLLLSEYAKYLLALVRTRVEGDPEHSRVAVVVGGRKPLTPLPVAYLH